MNRDGVYSFSNGFYRRQGSKVQTGLHSSFQQNGKRTQKFSNLTSFAEALRRYADEVEEKERLALALEQKTEQPRRGERMVFIKRWAKEHKMNWRSINWRKMKALSFGLGYEIKRYLTVITARLIFIIKSI